MVGSQISVVGKPSADLRLDYSLNSQESQEAILTSDAGNTAKVSSDSNTTLQGS